MFMTPLVAEMLTAVVDSCRNLRNEVSDVRYGPIDDGKQLVNFEFRDKSYSLPLEAGDDWVIAEDGRESDRSVALRLLLRMRASTPTAD